MSLLEKLLRQAAFSRAGEGRLLFEGCSTDKILEYQVLGGGSLQNPDMMAQIMIKDDLILAIMLYAKQAEGRNGMSQSPQLCRAVKRKQ